VLAALRDNGGVIHVNFIRPFIARDRFRVDAETRRDAACSCMRARWTTRQSRRRWRSGRFSTAPNATVADCRGHTSIHIRKVAGIDHIGIGADYYDVKEVTMVTGLANVTRYPYLFAELLGARGYFGMRTS
jgi:membrane dipeptidase